MRPSTVYRKLLGLFFIVLVFLLGYVSTPKSTTLSSRSLMPTLRALKTTNEVIKVKRVIDGDTIELVDGRKVRYIGMNTPELHDPRKPVECFAREAMIKNKELVEGKTVRLEKDISDKDKYGRLLRFVYFDDPVASSTSLFVNDYLVKLGYAVIDTVPPDVQFADLFRESEQEARQNNAGLWKTCK